MKPADGNILPLPLPRALARRRAHELAFLPAALEITETPASPAARAIGGTIIAFFVLALAWSFWGKVDIVATAQGKIIPTGRTKVIQPLEIGVVHAIRVEEGQSVRAGDVLIELDPTTSKAEREHLASDLVSAQLDIARLRAALNQADDLLAAFDPPAGASPALIALHRQFLLNQTAEQRAKLAALDRQQAQREAERATVAATIGKLEATIPVLRQRVEVRKYLTDREYGSKIIYLEVLQDLLEHEHELVVQKSHYNETEAAVAAIAETRKQTASEYQRTLFGELASAEQKAAGLAQDLVKAEQRSALQVLTAPVDGVVQQLQVATIGGVVTPAEQLMVVVPAESHLEIEAMVQNKDIGFVAAGQKAEIKIDTFNYTKYGLLHGTVLTVSRDSIARDKPVADKEKPPSASNVGNSQPQGQELVYAARISLDKTQMAVEDRLINLGPGMAVTAEIKTGQRRLIDYILSPILRYRQESLRER
ncbi:MAG TPA: HlyD family type I secretion periplasmic adaptor subunit [Stellaceae bacterium]|jgi:hemolysin D|nr:HlyD family type I secretion periplasmic adaptor subunit [Stellaceae bacterium]